MLAIYGDGGQKASRNIARLITELVLPPHRLKNPTDICQQIGGIRQSVGGTELFRYLSV
jgi:hypothetical protein